MITHDLAGFLQEGLAIHLGSRNQRLEPNGARADAVRVEDDGKSLVVYLSRVAAKRILPDLEANGFAAVSFGRPTDDRACQVKGVFITARPARAREREIVEEQREGFLRNCECIGIPRAGAERWARWPAVAIRLKVTAVFEQTPGPQAGTAIA